MGAEISSLFYEDETTDLTDVVNTVDVNSIGTDFVAVPPTPTHQEVVEPQIVIDPLPSIAPLASTLQSQSQLSDELDCKYHPATITDMSAVNAGDCSDDKTQDVDDEDCDGRTNVTEVTPPRCAAFTSPPLVYSTRTCGQSILFRNRTFKAKQLITLPLSSPSPAAELGLHMIRGSSLDNITILNATTPTTDANGITTTTPSSLQKTIDAPMPLYTRIMRILLIIIGIIPIRAHLTACKIYSLIVFLFLLTNILFVTLTNNSLSSEGGIKLLAQAFNNSAPLTAWLSAYVYVGHSHHRALIVFNQISNLEFYSRNVLRFHTILSLFAGLLLVTTSAYSDLPFSAEDHSTFALINLFLFFLLNYFITTFIMIMLASLICRFHVKTLLLFIDEMYQHKILVHNALLEHSVLLRLIRNSNIYVQYIIGLPLILYITGFTLTGYLMITSSNYSLLVSTAIRLFLALCMLLVPLYYAATINSTLYAVQRMSVEVDLIQHLSQRQAFIQQIAMTTDDYVFSIFSWPISKGGLAAFTWVIIAGTLVLTRSASS